MCGGQLFQSDCSVLVFRGIYTLNVFGKLSLGCRFVFVVVQNFVYANCQSVVYGVVLFVVLVHVVVDRKLTHKVVGVSLVGSKVDVVVGLEIARGIFLFGVFESDFLSQFLFHRAVEVGKYQILDVFDCVLRLIGGKVLDVAVLAAEVCVSMSVTLAFADVCVNLHILRVQTAHRRLEQRVGSIGTTVLIVQIVECIDHFADGYFLITDGNSCK